MKSDQSVKPLPRGRRSRKNHIQPPEPLVNAELLSILQNQGFSLHETSIEALGLQGCESKQLHTIGILTLEQLANSDEAVLRAVPHFGITKVKRLKSRLNSHLAKMLINVNQELDLQPLIQNDRPSNSMVTCEKDTHFSSTVDFISELEAASESLEKLEKRLRLYVAEMKKHERK